MSEYVQDVGDGIVPQQPLTSGKPQVDPKTQYTFGRHVIRIPLNPESIDEDKILKYLPHILKIHRENVGEIKHLEDVYLGKTHIWEKSRMFSESKKNNIINENHAFYMVEFKAGTLYGNDTEYTIADDEADNDEIKYLSKYMKDQDKSTKLLEVAHDVFKTGNAYTLTLPRVLNGGENLEKESTFEIFNLDNKTSFVVYSSTFTRKKLFGGVITSIESDNPDEVVYEINIYDKYYMYRYSYTKSNINMDVPDTAYGYKFIDKQRHFVGKVPFVEWYTNSARMGVIDLTESILDSVNSITSDSVDAINDYVNSILAIYNMEITRDTKKSIEESGAIALKTVDPTRPADAKYLVNELNQADVITKYEKLISVAYSIAGVPLPTTKSSSGGDTGEARSLAGGWENADSVANQQEEPLKQAERRMVECCLSICRQVPRCPINELFHTDININFNRKKSYNLLVKTQALQNLISIDMPEEIALNFVELTGNTHEVAKIWREYRESKKEKAVSIQPQEENENNNETMVE